MKIAILIISTLGILLFLAYPFLRREISFTQTNYLFKLKGEHKDYFERDYSDIDRHEIVDCSKYENDPKIKDILSMCDTSLLPYCNGKIILGYKDNKIVSVGYPRRIWDWCGTNRPSITIPIIVKNIDSIRYEFSKIYEMK